MDIILKWKSSKDERFEKSCPANTIRRNLKKKVRHCLLSIVSMAARGRTN